MRPKEQSFRLAEISELTGAKLFGDPAVIVSGICSFDEPRSGCISFSHLKSTAAIEKAVSGSPLAALIIKEGFDPEPVAGTIPLLQVKDPLHAMVQLVPVFYQEITQDTGISPKAEVDQSAEIGTNVRIGAFCWVGPDAKIGSNSVLYPGVIVYPGAVIGENSVIHSGAVIRELCVISGGSVVQNGAIIGAEGFGYYQTPEGPKAVPQVGVVTLGRGVDVGANACIDRATFGATKIAAESKIDNLVQIGHNVQVGSYSFICGGVDIGGSTKIGNGVTLGGASSVADHVVIEDGVRFGGRSAAANNLFTKGDYMGYPAIPAHKWRRLQVLLGKLPKIAERLRKVEKTVGIGKIDQIEEDVE